ncbi:MAG: Gfo/Idh/MocA family oxidoreductase [Planctomycetaceae bacterium]|nr:Gfo/Idh/MocA family oxidoreductase [Planctomycetaceae bacterium]
MKFSRRRFLAGTALGTGAFALNSAVAFAQEGPQNIAGFDKTQTEVDRTSVWQPFSDRKIRMGLVGYGLCQFSAAFELQNHPNVEIVGVSDLISDRCEALAKRVKCEKKFESLEKMVLDDTIEAIFVATDAPAHARHCIEAMKHGKHVASAVPAVFGSERGLEEADELLETVKKTGLVYMLFETSAYHDAVYASREIYKAGGFGKMIYTEGEYYHYGVEQLDSYKGWRIGLPPQYYPTHSNAYYVNVTGGSFTEVSCMGHTSPNFKSFQPENNVYRNPFGSEIALFRTSEGGMARMAVCWDMPEMHGEQGRNSGEKGSFWNGSFAAATPDVAELVKKLNLKKPALPPGVAAGGHGGSHGYLGNEFVEAILQNRRPLVDVISALNLTVSGIVAHQSALKGGELMKIPQFVF